jgi:hypothetical protein
MVKCRKQAKSKMHIAISYTFHPIYRNDYIEDELRALGHEVTLVGPPGYRPGYGNHVPLPEVLAALPHPPDVYLHVNPGKRYFPPGIEDLPMPTVCWLGDIHLGNWWQQVARFFDVVFLPHKDYVEGFHRVVGHTQVYWLPLYISPHIREHPGLPRIYEVGFVGNLVWAHRRTPRARRLRLLSERFRMNELYRFYTHQELSQVYSQSRIVVNITIGGDINLRLFEGTACGALVLTDSEANGLGELFEVGRELVVYQDDADLLDKVAYYLAHEDERAQIARAGQQRTLTDHTYTRRAQELLDIITSPTVQRLAPMRSASQSERLVARRKIHTHLHALDAILDEARAAGYNPLRRAWAVLPCLVRRLLI